MSADDLHTSTDAGPSPEPAPADKLPTFEPAPDRGLLLDTGDVGSTADAGHPELVVGAAFAGGLAVAMLLRRIGG